MAYRLHKETAQMRIKLESPVDKLTSHQRHWGRLVLSSGLPRPATAPRCGLCGKHPHIPSGWTENH